MKRIFFAFLIAALLSPIASYAGIYGTLSGKVFDDAKKPLVGATVRIEGTTLGAKTKTDGTFTIQRVNPGQHNVNVTFVGYAKYTTQVSISADNTTEITVNMESSSKTTTTVNVVADKEKLVDNNRRGVVRETSSQELSEVSREGIASIVALSAGVFVNDGGYFIRGSKSEDTKILSDGNDIGNQFTGGFGNTGLYNSPTVSQFATEQVQVLTGGISVEYGNVMGGVVNSVLKSGRTDQYEGFMRYRGEAEFLWGRQTSLRQIKMQAGELVVSKSGKGLELQGAGSNLLEFGVGGPIPLLENSTFFIAGSYRKDDFSGVSYKLIDPWGNNWGQLDNDGVWVKSLDGKLKFKLSDQISMIVGGKYGVTNTENASLSYLYSRDMPGTISSAYAVSGYDPSGVEERVAKQTVINQFITNFYARISHALSEESYYEFSISRTTNNEEASKRKSFGSPNFFTGFDLWYPSDNYALEGSELLAGKDHAIDVYTDVVSVDELPTNDRYNKIYRPLQNPITGYYEGAANSTGVNNPWGLENAFITHGNGSGFQFRKSSYWQIDGNYNQIVKTTLFKHNLKAGFEFRTYELRLNQNFAPWTTSSYYDVYTDENGGNIYAEKEAVKTKTSKPFKPSTGAAYAKDDIEYKGINFTAGVRLDFTDPNANYRTDPLHFVGYSSDSGFAKAKVKVQASPRINVSYPITENSNFNMAYGWMYQMPAFQTFYDNLTKEYINSSGLGIGNPNLDAQKTVQYEVGYANQFLPEYSIEFNAYYKDEYNSLGYAYVGAVPIPYYIYYTADYGNSKGVEITFRKAHTNHVSFNFNYTLSKSTSSSFTSVLAEDPYTGKKTSASESYPQAGVDRRHRLNGDVSLFWGDREGPAFGATHPIENANINFSGFWQTGFAYSKTNTRGALIGEPYTERQPSYWRVDMKIVKSFLMKDLFGESMGKTSLDIFVDVNNLLNMTGSVAVYAATGDPDDPGTLNNVSLGSFSEEPFYSASKVSISRPETYYATQYDDYGNRKYSTSADRNNDGIVTQQERFDNYIDYMNYRYAISNTYQTPRQVYFGFVVHF